jgi:MFS family permease
MRPLGSAIFGTYADRNGRRKALIVAVVGVGAPPRSSVLCRR